MYVAFLCQVPATASLIHPTPVVTFCRVPCGVAPLLVPALYNDPDLTAVVTLQVEYDQFVQKLSNFVNQEFSQFGQRLTMLERISQKIQDIGTQARQVSLGHGRAGRQSGGTDDFGNLVAVKGETLH